MIKKLFMNKPDFSIIVPCYNESKNIPIVVERLSKFSREVNFELILINNGSTDNSFSTMNELIKKYQFLKIVTIDKNIGYGHGIFAGLSSAKADILGYCHADLQTPPEEIIKAYKMIFKNKYDIEKTLIKGLRVNRKKEQLFLTNSLSKIAEIVLGYQMEDINGQPKVFSRKLFDNLKYPPTDFSFDVYLMYVAGLMNLELVTFPVDFGERVYGESKWASSIIKKYKTIMRYLISILKIAKDHYNVPKIY